MELGFKGKTALVTGASMGIGRAIAKGLAAEGVKLCIAARRRPLLEALAQDIVSSGGAQPHIAIVDLMPEGAPQKLAQEALQALGHIDILINCAGGARALAIDTPAQIWNELMTLNYDRVRDLTLAVVPHMIERKWGRIINISGSSEPHGVEGGTAPKAALHGFAKGLSREVAKHGVMINSLSPGPAKINSEQIRSRYSAEFLQDYARREIPVGRLGEPEELAFLAVCLASPLASFITGNIIHVDGGAHRFAFT